MHGLINRAIQCFVQDNYGFDRWQSMCFAAGLDEVEFEAMLHYEDELTDRLLDMVSAALKSPRDTVLEDIGTYLVSHPNVEALRRLLRFGGETFVDFLNSLEELPDRARLAVDDLVLPQLDVREVDPHHFRLTCRFPRPGFGHVAVGILRTLADDYGALVFLEHNGVLAGAEEIDITLIETAFAKGRSFEIGARAV